jgi:hypothetical protein
MIASLTKTERLLALSVLAGGDELVLLDELTPASCQRDEDIEGADAQPNRPPLFEQELLRWKQTKRTESYRRP